MAKVSKSKLQRILNSANKLMFSNILKLCKPTLFNVQYITLEVDCDNCSTTTTTTTVQ